MNTFRELLEADAYGDMSEEFIRFHGKEWCDKQELCTAGRKGSFGVHTFQDGVLKVSVDAEFVMDALFDIGYVVHQDDSPWFLVKTNGKVWANKLICFGGHIGFGLVRTDSELVMFLAKNFGPEWVNHKNIFGIHMGFHCSYRNLIPELALIGGSDFVNCVEKRSGNHIGFNASRDDLPLLAEISGDPKWINHTNDSGITCDGRVLSGGNNLKK